MNPITKGTKPLDSKMWNEIWQVRFDKPSGVLDSKKAKNHEDWAKETVRSKKQINQRDRSTCCYYTMDEKVGTITNQKLKTNTLESGYV